MFELFDIVSSSGAQAQQLRPALPTHQKVSGANNTEEDGAALIITRRPPR